MAFHPAEEKYGTVVEGPFAVVRGCKLCKWHDVRRKIPGSGRGSGMREGNKQRGRLIQHIKTAHPEEYAFAMEEAEKVAEKQRLLDQDVPRWREKKYPNGRPMYAPNGTFLDEKGNRSVFDDIDE